MPRTKFLPKPCRRCNALFTPTSAGRVYCANCPVGTRIRPDCWARGYSHEYQREVTAFKRKKHNLYALLRKIRAILEDMGKTDPTPEPDFDANPGPRPIAPVAASPPPTTTAPAAPTPVVPPTTATLPSGAPAPPDCYCCDTAPCIFDLMSSTLDQ